MTIEVRQLLIKSSVGVGGGDVAQREPSQEQQSDWRETMRQELLSECKAWLEERLRRERER